MCVCVCECAHARSPLTTAHPRARARLPRCPQVLSGLHAVSLELRAEWEAPAFRARFTGEHAGKAGAQIEFACGDATAFDWGPTASLLFVNSTCFTEPLMAKIAAIADRMPVGSFCVTFTRRLPSSLWQVREAQTYQMTWGKATVLIAEKLFRCAPAALVGTAPPIAELVAGGPLRPAGKVFGVGGPSYTATQIAINLRKVNRAFAAGRQLTTTHPSRASSNRAARASSPTPRAHHRYKRCAVQG